MTLLISIICFCILGGICFSLMVLKIDNDKPNDPFVCVVLLLLFAMCCACIGERTSAYQNHITIECKGYSIDTISSNTNIVKKDGIEDTVSTYKLKINIEH